MDSKVWDHVINGAKDVVLNDPGLEDERYKYEIARRLADARTSVLEGSPDWRERLGDGLTWHSSNPVYWRTAGHFMKWVNGLPETTLSPIQAFWSRDEKSVANRIRGLSKELPSSILSGSGTRTSLFSGLLMGLDIKQYPPYRHRVFNNAYKGTGYPEPESGGEEADEYEHALGFIDRFIDEAEQRGLRLSNRLDAQSVIWTLGDRLKQQDEVVEEDDDSPDIEDDPTRHPPSSPSRMTYYYPLNSCARSRRCSMKNGR